MKIPDEIVRKFTEKALATREKCKASAAAYRLAHPGADAVRSKARRSIAYASDPDAHAKDRAYFAAWYAENKEKVSARRASHPVESRVYAHNRRALIKGNGGKHTVSDIRKLGTLQKHKCVYCNSNIKNSFHVDHIMPLSLGGSNDRRNIQLLCATCNLRKNAKHPVEFAQQLGRLL